MANHAPSQSSRQRGRRTANAARHPRVSTIVAIGQIPVTPARVVLRLLNAMNSSRHGTTGRASRALADIMGRANPSTARSLLDRPGSSRSSPGQLAGRPADHVVGVPAPAVCPRRNRCGADISTGMPRTPRRGDTLAASRAFRFGRRSAASSTAGEARALLKSLANHHWLLLLRQRTEHECSERALATFPDLRASTAWCGRVSTRRRSGIRWPVPGVARAGDVVRLGPQVEMHERASPHAGVGLTTWNVMNSVPNSVMANAGVRLRPAFTGNARSRRACQRSGADENLSFHAASAPTNRPAGPAGHPAWQMHYNGTRGAQRGRNVRLPAAVSDINMSG